MTASATLELASGSRCAWSTFLPEAMPLLRLFCRCTGIGFRETPPPAGSTVLELIPPDPMRHASARGVRGAACRVGMPSAGGNNFAMIADWSRLPEEKQLFLCRYLLFLGTAPLLLAGKTAMVHGALARCGGYGAIFLGPSGIGKSTTMARLPAAWQVMADDCFMLSECDDGYVAQPMTTWSVWQSGKTMQVEPDPSQRVTVAAIHLLERGETEEFLPLTPQEARLGITASFSDMIAWHTSYYDPAVRSALYRCAYGFSDRMLTKLPVDRMLLSLTGSLEVLLGTPSA